MKLFMPFILPALTVLLFSACTPEEALLIPSQYPLWKKSVEADLNVLIPGHMDNLRRIYMNDTGFSYLRENPEAGVTAPARFPSGTIVVKEIFEGSSAAPGEAPDTLMAMIKAPEDIRARGGWIWVVKDFSTGEESIFEDQFCFTCHSDANNSHPYGDTNPDAIFRDYLFHFPAGGK
jgi:hypothetical protein